MTSKRVLTSISMLFVAATLTACGGGGGSTPPTPTPQTKAAPVATAVGVIDVNGIGSGATIGAAGGSISTPDGKITLTLPSGALAADTVISIVRITNTAHGGIGGSFRLTPDGQTFAQPVTIKFAYTDADLAGGDPASLGAAFQTAAGHWQWLGTPTIDTVAKTISISTTHFTDFSMVQGYRLQPLSKTLKVNESLALQVVYCYPPSSDSDLTPLGLKCDTPTAQGDVAPLFLVNEWSVNSIAGGNGTVGTVSGNGASATYKAPAKKPTPSTVAVSARVNLGSKGKTLVVSNVTITEGDSWTGTASFKDDEVNTASAEITWTQVSRENNIAVYAGTGTGTIASDNGMCSFPATSGPSNGLLYVDYNNTPPTYHGLAAAGTWPVTVTCINSDGSTETHTTPAALPVFGGSKGLDGVEAGGVVSTSPDGVMTIEGSDTDGVGGIFNWKFTRSP